MADIRGVGKKITYSEDNPISAEIEALRKSRDNIKRPPKDDEERERLARWLAHRGRDELEVTVGTACYAMAHFEMDCRMALFSRRACRHRSGPRLGLYTPGQRHRPKPRSLQTRS